MRTLRSMLKIGDRLLSLADFKHGPKTPQPQKTGHGRRWKKRQREDETGHGCTVLVQFAEQP